MKRLSIVRIQGEHPCSSCNWPVDSVYVQAKTEAAGYQFFQQNGGMCAECFLAEVFRGE